MRLQLVTFALSITLAVAGEKRFRPTALELAGASCSCNGEVVDRLLTFERDADGNPFKAGDTPFDLPYGISIVGQRRQKGKVGAPTENDLVIFDTEVPTGMDFDLAVDGEMKVIVLHENDDKSEPDDSQFGGTMNITFTKPVCQVNMLRFLDIESNERVFVSAIDEFSNQLERLRVPAGGEMGASSLEPLTFFNVANLDIELGEGKRATGALAALEFRVCNEKCPDGRGPKAGKCPECPAGQFSRNGKKCKCCKAGTFSKRDGQSKCKRCKRNSVAASCSKTCTRCLGNEVPNNDRSKCVPCQPGYEARKNKKCKPCKAGFYSKDGEKCLRCQGNTISKRKASECTPCKEGERANLRKKKCLTPSPTPSPIGPRIPGGSDTLAPVSDRNGSATPTSPVTSPPTSPVTSPPTTGSPTNAPTMLTSAPSCPPVMSRSATAYPIYALPAASELLPRSGSKAMSNSKSGKTGSLKVANSIYYPYSDGPSAGPTVAPSGRGRSDSAGGPDSTKSPTGSRVDDPECPEPRSECPDDADPIDIVPVTVVRSTGGKMTGGKMGGSLLSSRLVRGATVTIDGRSDIACLRRGSDCPDGFIRMDLIQSGGKMAGGKMGSSFDVAAETILGRNGVICSRSDCPIGFVRASAGGKMAGGKMGSSSANLVIGRSGASCVPEGTILLRSKSKAMARR